jgi:hypothetical protein
MKQNVEETPACPAIPVSGVTEVDAPPSEPDKGPLAVPRSASLSVSAAEASPPPVEPRQTRRSTRNQKELEETGSSPRRSRRKLEANSEQKISVLRKVSEISQ